MNWKEFIKPDWKKIVIFVVLHVLIIFIIPLAFFTNGYVVSLGDIIPWPLRVILNPALLSYGARGMGSLLLYPFLWLYWYLLSCLIVWIYDKVKKK